MAGLKIQAIHVGQTDVDDDASWPVGELRGQKIASGRVGPRFETDGVEEGLQCTA
jgi:hypothetical protein